jgi:type IV secretory pathway TraG/TraD family ATPase VirD4
LAASAVATWDGPAVVVSVKRDLYDVTVAARADKGELAVFDPAASTGLPSARWSPLQRVGTAGEALRTGRALAQAIPRNGVTGADYWAKHGESLLGSFMCVAGLSQLVAGWRERRRAGEHAADRDMGFDGGDGNGPGDQRLASPGSGG